MLHRLVDNIASPHPYRYYVDCDYGGCKAKGLTGKEKETLPLTPAEAIQRAIACGFKEYKAGRDGQDRFYRCQKHLLKFVAPV